MSIFLVHINETKEDIIETVQLGNQENLDMDKIHYVEDSLSDSVNEDKMYAGNNNKMVQHYDCENPENLEAYSLTEVNDCEIKQNDLINEDAYVLTLQKKYSTVVTAYTCEVHYQFRRWWCSAYQSYSRLETTHNEIEKTLRLTKEQCKSIIPQNEEESTTLRYYGIWGGSAFDISFKLNQDEYSVTYSGKKRKWETYLKSHTCHSDGYMNKWSFRTRVKKIQITYNIEEETILDEEGNLLPVKF